MAVWNRLTAFITGGAVTRAASDAVSPVLEPVRQHALQQNQLRVLDPASAARLRVQGHIEDSEAVEEASRSGVNQNRLQALVAMIQAAPSLGELDRMANRQTIERQDFNDALAQHLIPPQWWDGLWDLTHAKLDPVQLANAIHRGLVADPGLLAVDPPVGVGNVPAYPVYPIPALEEASAAGLDKDRLGVLVGLMGLPMGPHEAAQAVFRGILTQTDFERAIAEGNTRNEWAAAIFEQTRQIPTARDFFENALRGYHDLGWAQQEAKRHGMSEADSLVIYQNQGRPMNIRQITQAEARGGTFNPEPGEITDPYMASVVEGNLKPGYYDLALSLKYTMPSPFVIRQLTQSGVFDEATARDRLLWSGWYPPDAAAVAHSWAGGTATAADSHVSKAQTQLWTATHKAYVNDRIDLAAATKALGSAGVAPDSVAAVLHTWDAERELIRAGLSAANIKKAYRESVLPVDEAVARLVDLGWSVADANTYLPL